MPTKLFTWVSFYQEMASKLLRYKNKRNELLDWIYSNVVTGEPNSFLHDKKLQKLNDIDPFTVFGLLNRSSNKKNRLAIANKFKEFLNISTPLPTDFSGIPILNSINSHFFDVDSSNLEREIEEIWKIFKIILNHDDSNLAPLFDKVFPSLTLKTS